MIGKVFGLGVLGVFCLASFWLWLPTRASVSVSAQAPTVDLAARVQATDETLAGFTTVITERPLFHGSRRPEPEAEPQAPPPPPPEPTLTLLGVLSDGDEKLALVRTSTSPQLYRLEPNSVFGDWQIVEIQDNAIVVRKNGGADQVLRIGQ